MKTKKNSPMTNGGLISESFSFWFNFEEEVAKSIWASPFWVDSAQENDLAPFYGDHKQSEKLSEIKLPLVHKSTVVEWYYRILEIKPCGFESIIRDVCS